MDARQVAQVTFERHLVKNAYPGRGLAVGRAADDDGWMLVYFIMGRSENSRNRRFCADGDRLWTEPVDESKVEDPSLIIYDAMLALPGIQIVSNGDQTETVYETMLEGGRFAAALETRDREPDAPNYTPRITAKLDCRKGEKAISLSLLKANPVDPALTDRVTYRPADPSPGLAYGLTTYMGDGSPLPSYVGDPLLLPIDGSAGDVMHAYWKALDDDNRVSLAVKSVTDTGELREILIENRHE